MTKSSIRDLVKKGIAEDITNREYETLPHLSVVELSFGVYGMNAGLFHDPETGKLYAVLARNSLLFQLA